MAASIRELRVAAREDLRDHLAGLLVRERDPSRRIALRHLITQIDSGGAICVPKDLPPIRLHGAALPACEDSSSSDEEEEKKKKKKKKKARPLAEEAEDLLLRRAIREVRKRQVETLYGPDTKAEAKEEEEEEEEESFGGGPTEPADPFAEYAPAARTIAAWSHP